LAAYQRCLPIHPATRSSLPGVRVVEDFSHQALSELSIASQK
jgi:hypothetical protein